MDSSQGSQQAKVVDVAPVAAAFGTALDGLLTAWQGVKSSWLQFFTSEIGSALHAGNRVGLARLGLPSLNVPRATVLTALNAFARTSAGLVVAELAAQGKTGVTVQTPADDALDAEAELAVTQLATALGQSLGSEAARVHGPNSSVPATQQRVHAFGESLTDAQVRYILGAVLHGAGNSARILTLLGVTDVEIYSSEVMDTNTCEPCGEIDGAFLGSVATGFGQVYEYYPVHGYIDCLGRDRCRGTVVGVWRKDGE